MDGQKIKSDRGDGLKGEEGFRERDVKEGRKRVGRKKNNRTISKCTGMSRAGTYFQNSTTGRVALTLEVRLEVRLVLLMSRQESGVRGR